MAGMTDLTQWQSRLQAVGQRLASVFPPTQLKWLICALLLLWLAFSLAEFIWFSMPEPQTRPLHVNSSPLQTTHSSLSGIDKASAAELAKVQSWLWFGKAVEEEQAEEDPVVQPGIEDDAKETRLRLILRGVVASSEPRLAVAIIEGNNRQQRYKIGDKIQVSGRVSLAKVLADRVILDNGGRFESLFLFDTNNHKVAKKTGQTKKRRINNKTVLDHRKNKSLAQMAKGYRQQLINNPTSLADVIRVSIAKDTQGNVMGYTLRPGTHRKEFKAFGFKSGDIVTAVNGVALTDPAKALELYRTVRTATEADLVIKRGNEEISILVGINADD